MQKIGIGIPIRYNKLEPGNTYTGVADWGNCKRCRLHHTRKRVAIRREGGSGHIKILFIGEAPGQLEDKTGVPFVGTAGRIFQWYIKFVPFSFKYWITNAVGCRPVTLSFLDSRDDEREDLNLSDYIEGEDYELYDWNRNPTKGELSQCAPHIDEMIEHFKPHGVVYLGNIATSYKEPKYIVPEEALLEHDAKHFRHKSVRLPSGNSVTYRYLPTLELLHPAYIARLEYKLLTVKKEAKKLEHFVERFLEE